MFWNFINKLKKKPPAPSIKNRRIINEPVDEPDTSKLITDISTMRAFRVPISNECTFPNLVVESPSICCGNSDSGHGSCDVTK